MKVTRNTPDQLILSYVPWKTGLMLLAFFLLFLTSAFNEIRIGSGEVSDLITKLGVPLVVLGTLVVSLVQKIQIVLDRTSDSLTIQRRTVFGYRCEAYKLSDFRCGEMQRTKQKKDRMNTRPVLHFVHTNGTSTIPIFRGYTNWAWGMHEAIEVLNKWNTLHQADSDTQST